MSENTDQTVEHATSVGQTGGLPGDNAHWRTSQVPDDELASTVQRGDVASGGASSGSGGSGDVDQERSQDDVRRAVEEEVANGGDPAPSTSSES